MLVLTGYEQQFARPGWQVVPASDNREYVVEVRGFAEHGPAKPDGWLIDGGYISESARRSSSPRTRPHTLLFSLFFFFFLGAGPSPVSVQPPSPGPWWKGALGIWPINLPGF